jgi:hypothetical protein
MSGKIGSKTHRGGRGTSTREETDSITEERSSDGGGEAHGKGAAAEEITPTKT